MPSRRQHAFAVLSVTSLLATPLAAQSALAGYAPVNARYRVTSNAQSSQVMMGETQVAETKSDQTFTVVIARAGSAFTLLMTLDSATASSTSPVPLPDLSGALGMKFTGTMNADGKVATSAVTDKTGNPSTSPLATNMRSFLPRLKNGATAGSSWADTTTSVTKQNGADITTTLLTTYTLVGDTTVSGARAWNITAISQGKLSGSGNQQGADYTIAGNISGRGTIAVSAGGVLLGAELASDTNMLVEVPAASLTIPVTQKMTTRISKAS
jgi:phosphoribosylcarboxyaminoimidazole (NCAIR) mutase